MKFFPTLLAVAPLATSVMSRSVDKLDTRQACLRATDPLSTVIQTGRRPIQTYIDQRLSFGWIENADITAVFDFGRTTPQNPQLNFEIINSNATTWKALILSNYQDTRTETKARETVRISVQAARQVQDGIIPNTLNGCVQLSRLDGTWYVQTEF